MSKKIEIPLLFDPTEWNRLENALTAWAETQPALRAAILVGSRTRVDPAPDDWSDLDLMLFFTDCEAYIQNNDWLGAMGEMWAALLSRLPDGRPEWLVTYAGGYNVDFVLLDTGALSWLKQANPLPEPFARGYRVLVDKDGQAAHLPTATGQPPAQPLPTLEEFNRVITAFWYTAYYVARQLRRGDLFVAKFRDGNLKECLMTMLAWHARAAGKPSAKIWYMGRFMELWADPQAIRELPTTFAHYDAPDSWRALLACLPIFRRLACETAAHLGYAYPNSMDERMSGLVIGLAQASPLNDGLTPNAHHV